MGILLFHEKFWKIANIDIDCIIYKSEKNWEIMR